MGINEVTSIPKPVRKRSSMTIEDLRLEARAVDLPLAESFSISRATWTEAENVFVTVRSGDAYGLGEVMPSLDRHEVIASLEALDLTQLESPFDLEGVSDLLPASDARSALDMAMHDLAAKLANISVSDLLGVSSRLPPTSVTVPITTRDEMRARARRLADHPALKVKVGWDGDVEAVGAIRDVYTGSIRVDANEGWDVDDALERLADMADWNIELCEQPVAAADREGLRRVTDESSIPIYADESVRTAADVADLAGIVDGVNLKLRKAGGLRETMRAVNVARAHGLGVMIGCDLTSGVAATAEARVAACADHADVDGPLLLASDPCPGVAYEKGRLILPPGPGLGARGLPW
jgi:L-Ala-D/L-Glu epimerase / N-acetyl-D-glutamate racemase